MGIEAELIKGLDIVEELITESVNRELYFSIESQDYSIAWVESDQCFGRKSGYRIFQDGWDYVYSIHSTSPGIARCFYEDDGIVDYEIKHAPREYLLDFAVNLPQIIEAIRARDEDTIIVLEGVLARLDCSSSKSA